MSEALLGAVVGGLLAVVGGLAGSLLLDHLNDRRASRQLAAARRRRLQALRQEIRENLKIAAGGSARGNVRFVTDVWEDTKGDTADLTVEASDSLISAYALARAFNSLAGYDEAKVSWGAGYMDNQLRQVREEVAAALEHCVKVLNAAVVDADKQRK